MKLGLKINCTEVVGITHDFLDPTHTKFIHLLKIKFLKCKDLDFSGSCTVHGAADADGTIAFSGEGTATMEGEKVLFNMESAEFANVQYLGAECPLTEVNGKVSGSFSVEVESPLTDAESHGLKMVKQNLFYGGQAMELNNGKGGAVTGTEKTVSPGETTAIHLVGL